MPHYELEQGYTGLVAGVDETGRGPLAGPVVAAAIIFTQGVPAALRDLIDDSKCLAAVMRETLHDAMRRDPAILIGVGAASVAEIAAINILQASLLAMRRAVARLSTAPSVALIDGNKAPRLDCLTRTVIGGDAICLSIAAASIIAKVTRDRAMARLHARHPAYGWGSNAGYATMGHRSALRAHGATRHHRASFGTVRLLAAES